MYFQKSSDDTTTQDDKERQRINLDRYIENEKNELYQKTQILLKISNSSLSRHDVLNKTFEAFKPTKDTVEILGKLQRWTPKINFGILLYGPIGSGKTHLLKALCIKWATRYYCTMFRASGAIFDDLRGNMDNFEDAFSKYLLVDLLIVDDLGSENVTEWVQEKILMLIEKRINRNLPVMMSTNLMLDELQAKYGPRTYDRLKELMIFQEVKGYSKRSYVAKRGQDAWNNL